MDTAYAQQYSTPVLKKGYAVKEICKLQWDTPQGLRYKKVAGTNLGVTSFEVIDKNHIAFLSDASNEIIITEKSSGRALNRFTIANVPHDFAYDKGNFYVLFENTVVVYDEKGTTLKTIPYPNSLVGVERITRYNNSTYLLLPSGNSVLIESAFAASVNEVYKGWITSSGMFVYGKLNGANSYMVQVNGTDGKSYEKKFTTTLKTAGVYVVGSTHNRVVLDIQTYVSESPIQVERRLVTIEFGSQGLGDIISDIKVPDCYYVLSNKDVALASDGTVLHMVTAPQSAFLFSLTEVEQQKAQNYPALLLATKYHFNDHLLQVNEK
ncbi:MAG: hypothetical protein ACYDCN_09210 [Bacteroidia bacterium]